MVTVTLRHMKDHKPLQLPRWADFLGAAVKKNFEVDLFFRRGRRGSKRKTEVVFYGIFTNAQLAAYAYKNAFTWIHINMKRYQIPSWVNARGSGAATTIARNSYAEGVVDGLADFIAEAEQERALRRKEKQERLAVKLEKLKSEMAAPANQQMIKAEDIKLKEVYDDSDLEDSSDDDIGDDCISRRCGEYDARWEDKTELWAKHQAFLESKIAKVESQISRSEKRASTEGALVLHQEKVAETVLKTAGIKVNKGKRIAPRAGFDETAYDKGKEDSKMIDLDRRAIRD